jgi:hypothetical protein
VVDAHALLAVLVVAVAALGAAAGGFVYWRGRGVHPVLAHVLTLVQTLLVAQVALGLLLLTGDRRAADQLHYAYGSLSLGAALAPWFYAPAHPRRRLAWFSGCSALAAALAVRAFMTGS